MITPKDMMEMFEPSIRKTCDLIDGQIKQAQQNSKVKLKYLFMVGGFSESPYVYSKIKEYVETKGLKTIRPAYAWSAVVRGAAAKGVDGNGNLPIRNRKCRRHYGTACHKPFIKGIHRETDSYVCSVSGAKKAGKQMSWHLEKGQDFSTSTLPHASLPMYACFWPDEKKIVEVWLCATDADRPPSRQNSVGHTPLLLESNC